MSTTTKTLTNLAVYGDMEQGWGNDSTYVKSGSKALKLTGTASNAEITSAMPGAIALDPTHTYYVRMSVYTTDSALSGGAGVGMYWPIAEPGMDWKYRFRAIDIGTWVDVSWTATRTSWTAGSYAMRVDFDNNRIAGSCWFDEVMIIDLTAAWGAGSEPSKTWCDINLPFISGTKTVTIEARDDIKSAALKLISLSPNPVTTGSACLVSVSMEEITSRAYTLSHASWSGTGPYTQTLAVADDITPAGDYMIYGDHSMSVTARVAEYNAVLRAEVVQAGRVKVTAIGIKPTVDIPIRIIAGILPTIRTVTIRASSWSGTGPWIAEAGVGSAVQTAACGAISGTTVASAEAVTDCAMHVADVSGATVIIRAMLAKPTTDVTIGVTAL